MRKIGKYEVLDVLGKGAMGIVYKALDPDIGREVALKAIHFDGVRDSSEREDLIRRFLREGRAAGKLNHPNIVTIHEVGREGDLTYIVMQYIQGRSLQSILDSGRVFEPLEVDRLMIPLLRAVHYAHQNGVIHRDIKPGNVLVDLDGVPHLADFGVAKTAASTLTMAGMALGTPGYISPEQLQGQAADARSDVFSLGVLFYVLLTSKEPFAGKRISTVMHRIVHDESPPPSSLRPDLPAGYDVIAGRAMAKKPGDRYQSCAEMSAALESLDRTAASTLTVRLAEVEPRTRVRAREKEKKSIIAVSAAVFLLIAGATAAYKFHLFGGGRSAEAAPTGPLSAPVEAKAPAVPAPKPDPLGEKMGALRKAFEAGDYPGSVGLAREVLAADPGQGEAKDYFDRASAKVKEAESAALLTEARELLGDREYARALEAADKLLAAEPGDAEALQVKDGAEKGLSTIAVSRVLERQRKAEEGKDLLVLMSDIGPPAEAEARKEEALLLFNYYNDIKSMISNVSYGFPAGGRVRVKFYHLVTGLYKNTGEKKVLVEKVETWVFERQGQDWKIASLSGEGTGGPR
jgi:predicted Ser/Thr protein kinase